MDEVNGDDRAFDVQDLQLVRAIADNGSITRAARALGVSQPAASQQLHRVEHRVGLPLVERVGRGVRLTEAGRVMSRHAPAVTTALDAAAEELDDLRGLRKGRVRLMGFPSASPTILPLVLAHLHEHQPGVTVTYVEAEPPEAVAAVREGSADVALTFSYPGDRNDPHRSTAQGLSVRTVGRDDLVLVLPVGHRALCVVPGRSVRDDGAAPGTADAASVDLADLSEEKWIAGCPRCRGHLMELCSRGGFTPHITFETDNAVAVEALVAQGIGVATLPRLALESCPTLPGVATVPLPASEARRLHLVSAHGSGKVPSVRSLVTAVHVAIQHASGASENEEFQP